MPNCVVPQGKACLVVIDGWGVSAVPPASHDAIAHASTPNMAALRSSSSNGHVELLAHGRAVGLPTGLMGNSEVGHLNLGAGRIVYQDILRIDLAIENGEMKRNQVIQSAFEKAKNGNRRLVMVGLVSDGGVHSHIRHLLALLALAKEAAVPQTYVHVITDGRDTSPSSAKTYLRQLMDFMKEHNYGRIATTMGRYYAMDRDRRWERIKLAYEGMVGGVGDQIDQAGLLMRIEKGYANQPPETDEFIRPIIVDSAGCIKGEDSIIFFNYRSDRMRQIVETFGKAASAESMPFTSDFRAPGLNLATMTTYNAAFPYPVIMPPRPLKNVLAEWLVVHGINQCHVAETEKYAHVTFFFNGGQESTFKGEHRCMIPSPQVATYDMQPEMSCDGVANAVVENIGSGEFPFVMCNFAPPDMVGHTGNYEATLKAVEATDAAIGKVWEACKASGYTLLVTADHGNAEQMAGQDGNPHTAHTCSKVPLIVTGKKLLGQSDIDPEPALCDVAPTVLAIMGIPQPTEMTGHNLLKLG